MAVAVALPLALAGTVAAAPPGPTVPAEKRTAPDAGPASSSWVADELRVLRADVESLRQRPDSSVTAEVSALRSEVARLATAQADLERRLGVAGSEPPRSAPAEHGGGTGMSLGGALIFLTLGMALGWVASRLSQRWRDRRLRIRV